MNESSKLKYPGLDLESMSIVPNYQNWILDKFAPFLGDKILEVGAGCGNQTKFFWNRFKKGLTSFEPASEMFPLLEKAVGELETGDEKIETHNKYLSELVPNFLEKEPTGLFDSAMYINVLEHIEDDIEEMKNVYSVLKPGGHILTFSPAMNFLMSDFDRSIGHFRRYSLGEMKSKMKAAGFEIVQAYYMDSIGIIPWFLFFTLMKKKLNSKSADIYDKFVIPTLKAIEPNSILPFGKNIMVIGRKKE